MDPLVVTPVSGSLRRTNGTENVKIAKSLYGQLAVSCSLFFKHIPPCPDYSWNKNHSTAALISTFTFVQLGTKPEFFSRPTRPRLHQEGEGSFIYDFYGILILSTPSY